MLEIGGAVMSDQLGALGEIRRVQQLIGAVLHVADVGHVLVDVGKGALHCLDLQVPTLRRIGVQGGQIEVLEDAQGHQRRDALAIGGNFMQAMAVVVHADGAYPVRTVLGEVRQGHGAAIGLSVGHQPGRCFALVEIASSGGRDPAQRGSGRGMNEALSNGGCAPTRQEMLGKARLILEDVDMGLPFAMHDRRDDVAALGVFDRGLQAGFKGQLAELLVQGRPAGHCTRHSHGIPAAHRKSTGVLAGVVRGVPCGR